MPCSTCAKYRTQIARSRSDIAGAARALSRGGDRKLLDVIGEYRTQQAEHQRWLDDHIGREH